jgi:hypothetical protein
LIVSGLQDYPTRPLARISLPAISNYSETWKQSWKEISSQVQWSSSQKSMRASCIVLCISLFQRLVNRRADLFNALIQAGIIFKLSNPQGFLWAWIEVELFLRRQSRFGLRLYSRRTRVLITAFARSNRFFRSPLVSMYARTWNDDNEDQRT